MNRLRTSRGGKGRLALVIAAGMTGSALVLADQAVIFGLMVLGLLGVGLIGRAAALARNMFGSGPGVRATLGPMLRPPWSIIFAIAGIGGALAIATYFNLPLRWAPSADQRAVEAAFSGAIVAELRVKTVATLLPEGRHESENEGLQFQADRARLAAFMVDPLLNRDLGYTNVDHHGEWIDAGVENLDFQHVTVTGPDATVEADAEVWFNSDSYGIPPGSAHLGSPGHNGMHYQARLARTGARWRVRDYTWNFTYGGP